MQQWIDQEERSTVHRISTVAAMAYELDCILITCDKDFGERALRRRSRGIILLRLDSLPPDDYVSEAVRAIISREDWLGSFAVITPGRIRSRKLRFT